MTLDFFVLNNCQNIWEVNKLKESWALKMSIFKKCIFIYTIYDMIMRLNGNEITNLFNWGNLLFIYRTRVVHII